MGPLDSLPAEVTRKFDVFDWRNAAAILAGVHPGEWREILTVLGDFRLRASDIAKKGKGNKSEMAGILDGGLLRLGWRERKFNTRIVVDDTSRETPTHAVDCYKNRVALEVEWNNKDPSMIGTSTISGSCSTSASSTPGSS